MVGGLDGINSVYGSLRYGHMAVSWRKFYFDGKWGLDEMSKLSVGIERNVQL